MTPALLIVVAGIVVRWGMLAVVAVPMRAHIVKGTQVIIGVAETVLEQRIHQNPFAIALER